MAVLAAGILGANRYLEWRYELVAVAKNVTGGDPARAQWLFTRYGCSGCHTIAGVAGADGRVGPPLQDMRERVYIAGKIENNPSNLIGWIADPPHLSPDTPMPPPGISVAEARDIAAYLYSH